MNSKCLAIAFLLLGFVFFAQAVKAQTSNPVIYVVPSITDAKILQDASVPSSYISNNISVTASPGEFESASFVVKSSQDINAMLPEVSGLTGSAGTIPSSNIDVRVVKVWWQAGSSIRREENANAPKILTPELLLKDDALVKVDSSKNYLKINGNYIDISSPSGISGIPDQPTNDQFPVQDSVNLQPVNIPANTNKQFWITVKVPDNAAAGNYLGTIALKPTNAAINLNLKVLPIKLSEPRIEYSVYYGAVLKNPGTIYFDMKNQQQIESELKDIYDHGVANPTVKWQLSDSDLQWYMGLRKTIGMNNTNMYYLNFQIWAFGNDLAKLKSNIAKTINLTKPYGVQQLYIYGKDEQSMNNAANIAQINAAHEANAKIFCAQWTPELITESANLLDTGIAGATPDKKWSKMYHDLGHKVYLYNQPQVGEEKPETFRRNYGLLLWQVDYDGAMDENYQWTDDNNLWDDFDSTEFRDHVFAYPTVDGVIDTIQWEGFREGVDDMRYLATLQSTIATAKSQGKSTVAAENWLASLKSSNLNAQNLDAVRAQMVTYILALQGQTCTPRNCTSFGYKCGIWPDGCSGTIYCGFCNPTQICQSGQCVAKLIPSNVTIPQNCRVNQTCTIRIANCSSGLLVLRNQIGMPVNITRMVMSGDFPITFFSRSPYIRSFVPSSNGTVGVVMVCLGGTVWVERGGIVII